jgi:hypothetical protein
MTRHNDKSPKPSSNKLKKEAQARKTLAKENRKRQEAWKQQVALERSQCAENLLRQAKQGVKDPVETLNSIDRGETRTWSQRTPLDRMCHIYDSTNKLSHYRPDMSVLKELLLYCYEHTDIFEGKSSKDYINGLVAIASHRNRWLRPLEDWKPKSHNVWRQFDSLVRHLFAKYHVPSFMNTAWYAGATGNGIKEQRWFIHVGIGQNIRTASGLPIPMTKKMAHYFLQAPGEFSIPAAFRWAQVINMGGDERLVRSILSTRLGSNVTESDEFGISVIRWLILHPMLDPVHHGPIIDYVYDQKYTRSVPNPSPTGPRLLPPQPNFTMKGRNPTTLLNLVEMWHRRLGSLDKKGGPDISWNISGIPEFEHVEGEGENKKVYLITELINSKELRNEGNAMHHCVASYAHSCVSGRTSIWSLKRYDTLGNIDRLLTLEISNTQRMITQARGKYNKLPTERDMNLLVRWGLKGGPSLSNWIKKGR